MVCRACNTHNPTVQKKAAAQGWAELLAASVVAAHHGLQKSYTLIRPFAMLLSFNDYIYPLAYWYKHFVDWHWSADLLFKSTDLDNTRIPSHTFWKTSLPFHILLMWWSLKIPVNKYIEIWTKLVFTWSLCSLNGCFKIKPLFLSSPLPRYITACSSPRPWIKERNYFFYILYFREW